MEQQKKQLALDLLEQIIQIEKQLDQEAQKMIKQSQGLSIGMGDSVLAYHLKVLKELIEKI